MRLASWSQWWRQRKPLLDAGVYTAGNALPQAVNIALLPVFTRLLSPEEYGMLGYTTALALFLAAISNLSLHSFVLRHWFDATEEDRPRLMGTIAAYLVIHNAILLVIELIALPLFLTAIGVEVPLAFIRVVLVIAALESFSVLPLTYFRVRQQPGRFVALASFQVILGSALSLYLIAGKGMGVAGRYEGLLITQVVMMVLYGAIIARVGVLAWDRALLRRALAFSLPLVPTALLGSASLAADRLLLERMVPLAEVGRYSIGLALASGLALVSNGIYKAIEPDIYRASNGAQFHARLVRAKNYVVLGLLAIAILLIGLSHEVVEILAAPEYAGAAFVIGPLAVAMVLRGATITPSCYLMARYQTRWELAITAMAAFTVIVLDILLIPIFGIYGATAGAIGASAVGLAGYHVVTRRMGMDSWGFRRDGLAIVLGCAYALGVSLISTPFLMTTIGAKALLLAAPITYVGVRLWREGRPLSDAQGAEVSLG